jgi:hypothetical protein
VAQTSYTNNTKSMGSFAMQDTLTTTTPEPTAKRVLPRARMWIFFGIFFVAALGMYAGTMYRIQNYGYMGIGQDRLAHPENEKPTATPPQN